MLYFRGNTAKKQIVSHSLAYWNCNDTHQLIEDIIETFGNHLEELSITDRYWTLSQIGHHAWETYSEDPESDAATEISNRLIEIPNSQRKCLVAAIANFPRDSNLAYFSCDISCDLINDISETFGHYLCDLNLGDAFWLIRKISYEIWLSLDASPSAAAQEIIERLEELPQRQIEYLIQAFSDF